MLAILTALVVAACGSGAPSAVVVSTPLPTTAAPTSAATATPSAEPSAAGPATIPDPCTLLPKAAIDTILGASADDEGTPKELRDDTGVACDFEAGNGASLEVLVRTDFPSVDDFMDQLGFPSNPVPGLGEASQYLWSDMGTPPGAILWIYAKGLAIGMHVFKPGLTEAAGLDLLKTLAASLPPR